jgi:2-polyprenyl-6-methoxyphenol hydroxylase-like FAD-dependent oxidoreductase
MPSGRKVAIVGAGPHGLAVAAHLSATGVEVRVHGEVMEFWRRSMPVGMLLRSERAGSHIADPRRALTLERYESALGRDLPLPTLWR